MAAVFDFTDEAQLAAFVADFTSFCGLLKIRTKSQGKKDFSYTAWNEEQKTFQAERSGFDIVLKPRQIGMSTLEIARDLHHAIMFPGENVLVVVHDAGVKDQLFLTLRMMAERLNDFGLLPATRHSTKTEIVFRDTDSAVRIVEAGTTVEAAQKKGRSGTIHRLHATEVAFWSQAYETWSAIDAAKPDGAEVVIESTANGAGGLFYEQVMEAAAGKGGFKLHFFPWHKHVEYRKGVPPGFERSPRDKWEKKFRLEGCNDQQISWWRSKVDQPGWGLDRALQEYPIDIDSAFRVHGRQFFEPEEMDWLKEQTRDPIGRMQLVSKAGRHLGELVMFEPPIPGDDYIIGGDVSEGTGLDESAADVMHKRSGRTVATYASDHVEPGDFGLAMVEMGKIYNMAMLAPERNNHGHATLRAIEVEAKYPSSRIYKTEDDKLGWITTTVSRPVMIDDLGSAIRTHVMSTPCASVMRQCKTLIRNERGKVEARDKGKKGGSKDDRVIAWAIANQARLKPVKEITAVHIPGF